MAADAATRGCTAQTAITDMAFISLAFARIIGLAFRLGAFGLAYLPFDSHRLVAVAACLGVVARTRLASRRYRFSQVLCSS